jgi:hypothetical protein
MKDKMGKSFLNLTQLLESYFASINQIISMQEKLEYAEKQFKDSFIELETLKKLKIEGDLYELVEKIRDTGGQATLSVTLPDSSHK